jgi:hypothetical protein
MKRLISGFLFPLLVLTTIGCSTVAPRAGVEASSSLVTVTFESQPSRAELYVDGALIGSTDLSYRLTPGVHAIEMRREGFAPWQRQLTVRAGSSTRLAAILEKQQ